MKSTIVVRNARQHNLKFPVFIDNGVAATYNVKSFPTTIVVDPSGNVRFRDVGFNSNESPRLLSTIVELLLEESSAEADGSKLNKAIVGAKDEEERQ